MTVIEGGAVTMIEVSPTTLVLVASARTVCRYGLLAHIAATGRDIQAGALDYLPGERHQEH